MVIDSTPIDPHDLASHFTDNAGSRVFAERLGRLESDEQFVMALAQYIDFNECFAPCVANLAARVAASKHYRANNVPAAVSDRGAAVAANIFYAAIDEFAEPSANHIPHRTLAQHTLTTTREHFALGDEKFHTLSERRQSVEKTRNDVRTAYGFNEPDSDPERMLFNIGVHVAAEGTAASEFQNLKTHIDSTYPSLEETLRNALLHGVSAFHWIEIHAVVEWNHFKRAVDAANLAVQFRPRRCSTEAATNQLQAGIKYFEELQESFLGRLPSQN